MNRLHLFPGNPFPKGISLALADEIQQSFVTANSPHAEALKTEHGWVIHLFPGRSVLFESAKGKIYHGTEQTDPMDRSIKEEDRTIVLVESMQNPEDLATSIINGIGEKWQDPDEDGHLDDLLKA